MIGGLIMVTVIIPTYNREKTIVRAVESVLTQTYSDLELIVVDDCSTDNTEQLLMNIHDKRLCYIKLDKNSGACVARNKGIELSQGTYIAFQDSDDSWRSDKLEIQINTLKKFNADIVFCQAERHEFPAKFSKYFPKVNEGIISFENFIGESIVSTQLLFGKADCFRKILFDEKMPRLQDFELMIRMSQKYKIYFINKVLVDMYYQENSISVSSKKLIEAEKLILEKYKSIFEIYPKKASYHWSVLAKYCTIEGENANFAYKQAFYLNRGVNTFAKLILNYMSLSKILYLRK